MQIPCKTRQSLTLILFLVATSLVPQGIATLNAQAVPLREKKADISVFGTYTRLKPDYGPQENNGVTFGAFYTRYWHWLSPAIEFRVKIADGATVDQKTYGGGIRVEKQIAQRFRPFADFLVSAGTINYHQISPPNQSAPPNAPYVLHTYSDSSVVYTYGGGLDYDVTENFSARGEFQYENWSLGKYGPITLSPSMWSIGVVYRIPFKPIGFR